MIERIVPSDKPDLSESCFIVSRRRPAMSAGIAHTSINVDITAAGAPTRLHAGLMRSRGDCGGKFCCAARTFFMFPLIILIEFNVKRVDDEF
jgi:hypothetical protein